MSDYRGYEVVCKIKLKTFSRSKDSAVSEAHRLLEEMSKEEILDSLQFKVKGEYD